MNFGEWKARLQEGWPVGYNGWLLFLYQDTKIGIQVLTGDGTVKTIKDGEASLDNHFAILNDEQLQALADAFANRGIKTRNDHKNEGLLEATRYHLEDMRKIALGKRRG